MDHVAQCKRCTEPVIWMPTLAGKKVLLDVQYVRWYDTYFKPWRHTVHWERCPGGNR